MADRAAPLGGHLTHVIVLAVWLAVVAGVLLVDHARGNRWRDSPADADPTTDAEPPMTAAAGRISMATWPPRSGRTTTRPQARANEPRRGWWLPLVVIGSLVAAAVHLVVMPEHFEESTLYGVFFAGWVAWRPAPGLLRAGIAGNATIVALWAYTRAIEVPLGPGRGSTESVGGLDVLATFAEVTVVLGCMWAMRTFTPSRPVSPANRRHREAAAVGR
jgi:hypothetical protein